MRIGCLCMVKVTHIGANDDDNDDDDDDDDVFWFIFGHVLDPQPCT